MKKIILTLALAATAFGFTAMAQTAPACTHDGNCPHAQRLAPGDNNKMARPQNFQERAFEGILLSVDQQERINQLHNSMQAECQKGQCDKAGKKCDGKGQCKEGQCKHEGKGHKCDGKGGKHGMRPMSSEAKKAYMAKVKEILTPEQYTVFLENMASMPQPNGKMMPKHKALGADCKGHKDGCKGDGKHCGKAAKSDAKKVQTGVKVK